MLKNEQETAARHTALPLSSSPVAHAQQLQEQQPHESPWHCTSANREGGKESTYTSTEEKVSSSPAANVTL